MFSTTVHADLRNGLVGWWKFDEASGNAVDSTGSGNTGTPTGTTIVSNCKRGGCRSFNGTSDYVTISDNSSLNPTSAISLTAWVKTQVGSNNAVVSKYNSNSSSREYWMIIGDGTSSGVVYALASSDGLVFNSRISSITVNDGNWHHIVMTFNASGVVYPNIYVDGVIANGATTGVNTINSLYNGTSPVTISTVINVAGTRTYYFDGLIDDVRIYNRVLTAQEVRDLFIPGIVLRNGVVRNGKINQ